MFTGQMPFTQYNINEKIGRESENVLKSQLTENFIFYLCLKKVSFRLLHEMRKRLKVFDLIRHTNDTTLGQTQ